MDNVPRLKSTLLNEVNNKWYYKGTPYTGIIFFDKEDNQLDVYIAHEGILIEPYISPCRHNLPSIIQLDTTEFSCEIDDIHGSGAIPQLYKNKLYQGMSYTFIDGKCDLELYTHEDGISENRIEWNLNSYDPKEFFLNHHSDNLMYSYNLTWNKVQFSYRDWNYEYKEEIVSIEYHPITKRVRKFKATRNALVNKRYLSCPINVPEVYRKIESYHDIIFDDFFILDLDKQIQEEFFKLWINNESFKYVETLYIKNIENFKELSLLNNKSIFSNLKKVWLKNVTSLDKDRLEVIQPKFEVVIL